MVTKMEIWAHRGASAYAPENTMEAFRLAIAMEADGIELDVQLSKDGVPVIIHDETLKRLSGASGYVKDRTLKELGEIMPIPTLWEVLELLQPTRLNLNIELKTGRVFYPNIEQKVLELVKKYSMKGRVWYSSFNHYTIKKILELCPDAKTGLLYSDGIYEPVQYAKGLGAAALHPSVINLQYPEYKDKCAEWNIRIHPWTADSLPDIKKCVQSGADAVITNYPDIARLVTKRYADNSYPFDNPFKMQPNRSVILFGAGEYGQRFLHEFAGQCKTELILDNDKEKWGGLLKGVRIVPPDLQLLESYIRENTCVIVAGRFYVQMIKQLMNLGIGNYYIYDETNDWM